MTPWTPADERAYEKTRRRLRHECFGFYRDMEVKETFVLTVQPVKSPDLPVGRKRSSKEPHYGEKEQLLQTIVEMRKAGMTRKQMASQVGICVSYLGKLLQVARVKGGISKDCVKCGKPTERRPEARYCRECQPEVRKEQMRVYALTHSKKQEVLSNG